MRYPPLVSLVNTIVRARTFAGAMDDAADRGASAAPSEAGGGDFRVLGPAPAPLGKLRGEYRAQFLIKGTNRKRMREALLAALAARPELADGRRRRRSDSSDLVQRSLNLDCDGSTDLTSGTLRKICRSEIARISKSSDLNI